MNACVANTNNIHLDDITYSDSLQKYCADPIPVYKYET